MDVLQATCIALIQGITEFLPISSSAHVQFPALLLGWEDQGLHFDVATHAGSLVAVLIYFRHRLISLARGSFNTLRYRQPSNEFSTVMKLAIATLPVVIAGYFAQDIVANEARNLLIIVVNTVLFALLLWFADIVGKRHQHQASSNESPTYLAAFLIGLAQVTALMPGVSRSGVTMTAALLLGMSRTHSATFAFLLAIPVIFAAFTFTSTDLYFSQTAFDLSTFLVGFLVAMGSAYLCIDIFLKIIERVGMLPFVIYRLLIGLALGIVLWL